MTMIKINPDLQFSVLCDDVRREDNGKFMLLGLFEAISAQKFPALHHSMFIANQWVKGEGAFDQEIFIINSRDKSVIFKTDKQHFELPGIDAHHTLISRFANLEFPEPGKYWIEIVLDGKLVINYPMILKQIQEAPRGYDGKQDR
jgi:hypothetical protein